ncbi:MAG: thermonuclease family protein [Luteolibacter sp.]
MAAKSKGKASSPLIALIIIAAVFLWLRDAREAKKSGSGNPPPVSSQTQSPSQSPARPGAYEVYQNCRLIDHGSNDGDSFLIQLPDGRQETFRLYYVDTPESKFRRYQNGETNFERIRQQADELGRITPEQAVEIGQQGKHFTLDLLKSAPFTLYTVWDSPYHDQRYHAFILVRGGYLHQLLIEKGLARIKTKPAPLPDGTSVSAEQQRLRTLENTARKNRVGVWKFTES